MKSRGLLLNPGSMCSVTMHALKDAGITDIVEVENEGEFLQLLKDGSGFGIAAACLRESRIPLRVECPLLIIPGELTPGTLPGGLFRSEIAKEAGVLLRYGVNRISRLQLGFGTLIGRSTGMKEIYRDIERIAPSALTVLIRGESGTGKELVAHEIHHRSRRRNGPFVIVNCGALTSSLLQSELFGHERGAFTGALRSRKGRFEAAEGGTIFLDEIDSADATFQANLLRIIEKKEFERVGSSSTRKVDTRILAATNGNLEKAVSDGAFRQDLYFRLRGYEIRIPPLRERNGDLALLAASFLGDCGVDTGPSLTDGALSVLHSYWWPGNVRELQNCLHSARVIADGGLIDSPHLPPSIREPECMMPADREISEWLSSRVKGVMEDGDGDAAGTLHRQIMESIERSLIRMVLSESGWNIKKSSRVLGIARNTLKERLRRYELHGDDYGESVSGFEPGRPDRFV